LAAIVILLFPMAYFFLATPAFLLVKLDIPQVTQLLRGMFNAHFLMTSIAGVIGTVTFALTGRPVFAIAVALIAAVVISLLTPLLWTTWRPRFLPWQLESYINGVHNLGAPQPWLFPIFPWTGFAFAGLSVGSILASGFSKKLGSRIFLLTGVSGVALVYAARLSDSLSWQIYPVYDYWHTSPSFFLLRVGMLLILVLGAYAWCRWGMGQIGFSPLIQLGKTSLLVYWVHIELVYGRFHILAPRSQTILGASKGLLTIFLAMLALSLVRTAWKARTASQFRGRKPAQAAG